MTDPSAQEAPPVQQGRPRNTTLVAACLFFWPLLYNYRLLISGQDFSILLGNDFSVLYYAYKAYLVEHLAQGILPLWSPGEAAGYPFYSNPFTQSLYPLNLLLVPYYWLAGGYTGYDHQIYTVLGASIFCVGLYFWLSMHILDAKAVIYACLAVSISYKLGETFRFPNATHAAAWMPWILYGISLAARKENGKRAFWVLFLSCLLLITSGYLYYSYYMLFLAPYAIVLVLYGRTMRDEGFQIDFTVGIPRFLVRMAVPAALAMGLCLPYLYKVFQMLEQTVDRSGGRYAYSIQYAYSFQDSVGSLLYPPIASMEGWYYFGIANLFLAGIGLLVCLYSRRRRTRLNLFLYASLGLWFLFVSSVTWADRSVVFDLLWNILPGFSHLRAWARLNIVLLPLLALLLARSVQVVLAFAADVREGSETPRTASAVLASFAVLAALLLSVQYSLYRSGASSQYWTVYNAYCLGKEHLYVTAGLTAGIAATAFLFCIRRRVALRGGLVLALLAVLTVIDVRPVGSLQWATEASPPPPNAHEPIGFTDKVKSFRTQRVNVYWTIPRAPFQNTGILLNWYYQRYARLYRSVFPNILDIKRANPQDVSEFQTLMGISNGQRLYFSSGISHASIGDFLRDAQEFYRKPGLSLRLKAFTGDRLEIEATIHSDGYISYIDNWDPDWKASVDGQEVPIRLLLGTFKSVALRAGTHTVVFRYCPFSLS